MKKMKMMLCMPFPANSSQHNSQYSKCGFRIDLTILGRITESIPVASVYPILYQMSNSRKV